MRIIIRKRDGSIKEVESPREGEETLVRIKEPVEISFRKDLGGIFVEIRALE